jgi:hypothetical protein
MEGDRRLRQPFSWISGRSEVSPKKLTAWPAAAAFRWPATGIPMNKMYSVVCVTRDSTRSKRIRLSGSGGAGWPAAPANARDHHPENGEPHRLVRQIS